jgi:WhiB family redox-sensing transcriptional regulator
VATVKRVLRTLARSSWMTREGSGGGEVIDRQKSLGFTAVPAVPVLKRRLSRYGRRPVQGGHGQSGWVMARGKNIPSGGLVRTVAAVASTLRVGASGPTGAGDSDLWRDRAACRAVPMECFFPVGRIADSVEQTEAAKAICRSCPMRASGLGFALESNQKVGIWGGATQDQRRGLRRTWLQASRHHRATKPHNGACSGPPAGSSGRLKATGGNIKQSDGA